MSSVGRFLAMVIRRAWLPVLLVVLWWVTSANSTNPYLPPLSEIVSTIWNEWIIGPRFAHDMIPTLRNFFIGLAIAMIGGTILGVILGLSPYLRAFFAPIINFARSLPAPALIPIVFAIVGLGPALSITLIAVGAIWPTLLNTMDGVRSLDTQVRDMVRSYRLTGSQRTWDVILPNAGPQIVAGYRVTLQISIILIVVSEMVGSAVGLGFYVREAPQQFDYVGTWAATILLGLLGYILTTIFVAVERRALQWQIRMRAATGAG